MRTEPPWAGGAAAWTRLPLRESVRTDVCVVGGGAAGLLTGLLLARHRVPVVVLRPEGGDDGLPGAAHATVALDGGYRELERRRGGEAARLAAESRSAALELIGGLCAAHGIACDLEPVDAFIVGQGGDEGELDEEAAAARRAGLIEVERLQRVPGEVFGTASCLRYPRQAQLHPARFLAGLAHALERMGARIYGCGALTRIEGGPPMRVSTASGPAVTADSVVLAPPPAVGALPPTEAGVAQRTYVVAAPVPPRSIHRALYWERGRSGHHARLFAPGGAEERGELLVVGGEEHPVGRTAEAEQRFGRLESWMRERFPMAQAVTHRWSGGTVEPPDGVAAIGPHPGAPGVFFASARAGAEITQAAVAAMVLSDLALGRPNPWAELYAPTRLRGRFRSFARGGLRLARGVSAWLSPSFSQTQRRG